MREPPTAHALAATLSAFSYRYANEAELADSIEAVLTRRGHDVQREVRLDERSRLDFLVGHVAIEVKIAGSTDGLRRQVARYVQHESVGAVLVITTRARHLALDGWTCDGFPVRVVNISRPT